WGKREAHRAAKQITLLAPTSCAGTSPHNFYWDAGCWARSRRLSENLRHEPGPVAQLATGSSLTLRCEITTPLGRPLQN
ncbi:MAG: hypothetical protein ACLQLC_18630, partial [Candidatus Sulfotelmatobacter sp.]